MLVIVGYVGGDVIAPNVNVTPDASSGPVRRPRYTGAKIPAAREGPPVPAQAPAVAARTTNPSRSRVAVFGPVPVAMPTALVTPLGPGVPTLSSNPSAMNGDAPGCVISDTR